MWEAPKKDRRYLLYVPDYTLPYFFKEQNISGFGSVLSSIGHGLWKGITYIPKKVYNLGYHIFKHKSNPSGVVTQGANDLAKAYASGAGPAALSPLFGGGRVATGVHVSAVASPGAGVSASATGKVKPSIFKSFWDAVKEAGKDVASVFLQSKVLNASQQSGIPQSQAYNQSLAWAMAHEDELKKMGYPSPEAAASEALWQNNGRPPSPNQDTSILPSLGGSIKKYWWILALLIAIPLIRRD